MNKGIAIGFALAGATSWYWPTFNGFWFPPSDVSTGDGHIIASIFWVGAAILWFMRAPTQS